MMSIRLFACIGFLCVSLHLAAQTSQPSSHKTNIDLDCKLDPEIFPAETCSAIQAFMGPADTLGPVGEDGTFSVLSPGPDGKNTFREFKLPPRLRSEIAFKSVSQTIRSVEISAKGKPKSIFAAMLPDGRNLWLQLREVFCYYHPGGKFLDLADQSQTCFAVSALPEDETVEKEFQGAMLYAANFQEFLNAELAKHLEE